MKKLLALLLTLSLVLYGLSFAVADDPDEIPGTAEMPSAGLRFVPPEEFRNTDGIVITEGSASLGWKVSYAYWLYCAMTEDELNALYYDAEAAANAPIIDLFYVFSVGNGMDFETLNETKLGSFCDMQYVREIGQEGDYTFYLYMAPDPAFASGLGEPYAEEYAKLSGLADQVAAAFTCYAPVSSSLVGTKVEFTAKDLDGNEISSADLFAQNEITMVNIWATWCGPCIRELPELQKIHLRIQENGCGIVGLLDDEDLESARQLISENGVTYPVIVAPDNLYDVFPLEAYPSSFFVSRDGVIIADPIVGAYVDDYEAAINLFLQNQ